MNTQFLAVSIVVRHKFLLYTQVPIVIRRESLTFHGNAWEVVTV
jgi:hypothetical protein